MRRIVSLLPKALLGLAMLGTAAVHAVEVRFERVADGVYAFIGETGARTPANEGLNANLGLVVRPAGTLLIDSGATLEGARQIRGEVGGQRDDVRLAQRSQRREEQTDKGDQQDKNQRTGASVHGQCLQVTPVLHEEVLAGDNGCSAAGGRGVHFVSALHVRFRLHTLTSGETLHCAGRCQRGSSTGQDQHSQQPRRHHLQNDEVGQKPWDLAEQQ
jgi:hypothetical protein